MHGSDAINVAKRRLFARCSARAVSAAGLLGRFHLLGSSWGTVVAQLYALQTPPPPQLASLVLSGPLSDGQLYINSQWDEVEGGLGTLPLFTQQRIRVVTVAPRTGAALLHVVGNDPTVARRHDT